jgi:hypothetical protein
VHIIFVDTFQLSACHVSIILNSDVLACVLIVLKSALPDADSTGNRSQTIGRRKGIEFLHACWDPYLLFSLTHVVQEIGNGWNTHKNPASSDRGEVHS